LELSAQLSDKVARPRLLNSLGWVYGELYNLDASLRCNWEAAEIAYTLGEPELIRYAELNLAANYHLLGDLDQAQQYLERVHRAVRQPGKWGDEWMKWRYSQYLYHGLGELWLARGDAEQALSFAGECLGLAERTLTRKNLVKGWRLKGQALAALGRQPEAAEALRQAFVVAREIGNPPQLWQTYRALGQLHEDLGDTQAARSSYARASQVIDEVAGRLRNPEIQRTFLSAHAAQEIRASLARLQG
jgi:tetratricopeptide (TPR) repeat protein